MIFIYSISYVAPTLVITLNYVIFSKIYQSRHIHVRVRAYNYIDTTWYIQVQNNGLLNN